MLIYILHMVKEIQHVMNSVVNSCIAKKWSYLAFISAKRQY